MTGSLSFSLTAALAGVLFGFPVSYAAHRVSDQYLRHDFRKTDPVVCAAVLAVFFGLCQGRENLFGFTMASLFAALLLCAALVDSHVKALPNLLVGAAAITAIAHLTPGLSAIAAKPLMDALTGAFAASLPLLALDRLSAFTLKRRAFGFGDVKLYAACGLFLGLGRAIISMAFAFTLAAAWSLAMIAARRAKGGSYIAFGPFIAAGTLLSYIFGGAILAWYAV